MSKDILISQGYVQLGLVTNDYQKAMRHIGQVHGIRSFKQMHDLTIGARGEKTITANFALAFSGSTQFEIIEPLAGDLDFYRDGLPDGEDLALRVHHLGRYCPTLDVYADARTTASTWPCVVQHDYLDGGYCYYDCRSTLGHYLEFFTFPPTNHFEDIPMF